MLRMSTEALMTKTPEEQSGPQRRLRAFLEERFGQIAADGEMGLTDVPPNYLTEKMSAYRDRQQARVNTWANTWAGRAQEPEAGNWVPIGPSIILRGQSANEAGM